MNVTNTISGSLRLVCGVTLMAFSFVTYHRLINLIAAGGQFELADITISASPGQFRFALAVVGLIGALLVILGVVTLSKRRG